jgi:CHAT domain-containing protein
LAINEKYYGLQHPQSTQCIEKLAWFTYCAGDSSLTLGYATKWFAGLQKELLSMLTLDERSRLSWQLNKNVYWLACVLPPDSLAKLTLKHKGAVLESLAEDRALAMATGSFGEGANILQNIQSLKSKLSKIVFDKNNEEEASKLQDEIGSLQRELTLKYLGRERHRASASITMADIMPALAGSGVLVDVIQFYDPKLKGDEETCLGAIITGEDNNPVFVRIDGGSAINRAIDSLRAAINQGNSIEVEAKTKFLSEKLWAPIAAKIPEGTKRLFLSPDANLNFLSFAALLDSDGRFVAEKYPITYIGSARDLAKKPSGKISKSMALIANPQFDAADKNAKTNDLVAMRSAEADVFGSIALPPLPGTEAEATSLQALATESGWETKSYLGKDATEPSVRNTKKPGVLHLATHGFYLNSFTPPGPEGSRGMSVVGVKETTEEKKKKEKGVDPMRASGVAFTGAQQTLTSWSQRKAPNPETDGVLTAEEVGALRLDGTWLVVLSACETGVGEARSGEGVFGLRRAFMIAGAENLLMTLWPVADETTAKIMTDFYKEAFATGDAHGSLAKVQRDWLVKLRQERGLLAAVREAGPFAMVAMTAPSVKTFNSSAKN